MSTDTQTDEEHETRVNWGVIVFIIVVIAAVIAIWYRAPKMSDKTTKRLVGLSVASDAVNMLT